jgi:shikimate kinase
MKIALYGFMGAGKSTLGQALAQRLGYHFVDLDKAIEDYNAQCVNQIFETQGELAFRKLEHQVLKDFIKKNQDNVVLALGGGSILQPTNRKLLELRQYYKIYLDVSIDQLIKRLSSDKAQRPLLKDLTEEEFEGFVRALFESRKAVYEQHADLKLPISQENFFQALEKLTTYLNLN